MNKRIAEQLVAEYIAYGSILNRITEVSYAIEDPTARSAIRRAAFDAACALYEGIRDALGDEFKDLLPDDTKSLPDE